MCTHYSLSDKIIIRIYIFLFIFDLVCNTLFKVLMSRVTLRGFYGIKITLASKIDQYRNLMSQLTHLSVYRFFLHLNVLKLVVIVCSLGFKSLNKCICWCTSRSKTSKYLRTLRIKNKGYILLRTSTNFSH